MKGSPEQKLETKREAWLMRTAKALDIRVAEARELLSQERRQSIRLNPLIANPADIVAQLPAIGWSGHAYSWIENCYTIEEGALAIRDSSVVEKGAVFVQNAASWLPVLALAPKPGERILDVCAAPGGKSSHIAAITGNQSRLWVNDNSRPRLLKMQANLKRLRVLVKDCTLYDATQLSRKLKGITFDKILLDAPCSGEGLMRYDRDKDFMTWSVAHVKRLQQLQKRILVQAWQLLEPGGTLVYSTCTMAPEENEAVVDYLLRTHPDASIEPISIDISNKVPVLQSWNSKSFNPSIEGCLRLKPSKDIEAFFVCKLKKVATDDQYMI